MSLHCLLCLLHCNVVSLCRCFVTTELVSLEEEESARTLGVLDVDGLKERFNAKNSHAQVGHSRFSFLADHVWAACARKDVRGGGLFAGIRDNIASLF